MQVGREVSPARRLASELVEAESRRVAASAVRELVIVAEGVAETVQSSRSMIAAMRRVPSRTNPTLSAFAFGLGPTQHSPWYSTPA